VKQGDGTLIRIPVLYGDTDRQVAHIMTQNSENTANSSPRISVYISELGLDRDRLSDASFVGKLQLRERRIENGKYTGDQGENFTVERLMPTPYKLTVKVDIWSSSTDQKLQILEQILMFFNPSLEIQTGDNFVDWTSLSVVDLKDVTFSSRSIPVGGSTAIDIATLVLETPIWISPPAKVKKMGIITRVITSFYDTIAPGDEGYIGGLGTTLGDTNDAPAGYEFDITQTIGNYDIIVSGKTVMAYSMTQNQSYVSWDHIIDQNPGTYIPGLLKIFLIQPDGSEIIGYGTVNPMDETMLIIGEWDPDTYPANTFIPGPARYSGSFGTFDAVLNPIESGPKDLVAGTRYLIVNGIGGGVRESVVINKPITILNTTQPYDSVVNFTFKVNGVDTLATAITSTLYPTRSPINMSGNGHGAAFDITAIFYDRTYIAALIAPGGGYTIGNKLKIRGTTLDGEDVINDCLIIITNVDSTGAIAEFTVHGTAGPRYFSFSVSSILNVADMVEYELYVNHDGADAWKNVDGSDFIANENDLIEWDGSKWHVIMSAKNNTNLSSPLYQTNLYTLTQYKWDGINWSKSFDGEYNRKNWRMIL
jgi:hypothetical protein